MDSSGNLYVADYGNSRVLEYNTPLTTDTTADRVFGQDDSFSSSDCNFGATSASAHSLCSPSGVAVDASGDLYVADTSNNRVLKYNPPFATNPIADVALGQANLTYNAANFPDAQKLDSPQGVAIDASTTPNRLYVADVQNSRVLGWKDVTAFTNGASADLVIGQPDPYSTACNSDTGGGNPTDDDLCNPYGVAVDAAGNLYVADASNNRVLEYTTPFAECGSFPCVGGSAHLVFGQGGIFTSNTANNGGVSAKSLDFPWGVAVDANGNLYVADTVNNRVLEYNIPLTYGTTAHSVFGQGGIFTSNTANNGGVSANSLYYPNGVAVDAAGQLYVADFSNSRVLEYNTPLTSSTANAVFGHGSFNSNTPNDGGLGASSLNYPSGVVVDATGNLYVADYLNNRVLEYNTPLTSSAANAVFGQGDSFDSADCNNSGVSASSLCSPWGVAVDAAGNLYVADTANNRVLKYNTPLIATPDTHNSGTPPRLRRQLRLRRQPRPRRRLRQPQRRAPRRRRQLRQPQRRAPRRRRRLRQPPRPAPRPRRRPEPQRQQ